MPRPAAILNMAGDFEESIIQLSRHLGTEKIRRDVFKLIYGRIRKPRSKKQIMSDLKYEDGKAQQVQNALDHLSKYHLIDKIDNDGSVKDGSRNLYQKEPGLTGHKDKIIKFADDKKLARSTATKRRPVVQIGPAIQSVRSRELKKRKKLVVLFLTSNPDPNYPLRVDAELRRVQEAVRGSKFRDNVDVVYRPAADLNSLLDGLNDLSPQIVHFSGHGDFGGVVTDSGAVDNLPNDQSSYAEHISYDLLAKALKATPSPPSVLVLNSCWGSKGERVLSKAIKFVVSMNAPISDIAATAFAPRFYAAIASGVSVQLAFDQAKIAVEAASISDAATPELFASEDAGSAILT